MANGKPGRPKGLPKTGGRKKGAGDKCTAALVELCQTYTVESVNTIRDIMRNTDAPEAARLAAARELLERGHGKAAQPVTGADGGALIVQLLKFA